MRAEIRKNNNRPFCFLANHFRITPPKIWGQTLLLLALTSFFFPSGPLNPAWARPAGPGPLVLGQSCALSGPAANLGIQFRAGLLAALNEINDQGGIRGRPVILKSLDDGYEPDRAIRNTRQLIQDDRVFLLIGEVGTPTSKAVQPLVNRYHIPFFTPFTGARLLRTPFRPLVINLRPGYDQEMEQLCAYLVDCLHLRRLACFFQNDSYGYAGLEGIQQALARRGMSLVSRGSYERNTVAVLGGLRAIAQADPEAVVLVGTYTACAEFIKLAKAKYPGRRIYASISFVGAESLRRALGGYGKDVIVSQVVPFPWRDDLPLARKYRQAMRKYQHDLPIGFVSLEGYMAGQLFGAVASQVEGSLTRDSFVATIDRHGRFEIGGVTLRFGPRDHQGSDTVYLTRLYPKISIIAGTCNYLSSRDSASDPVPAEARP